MRRSRSRQGLVAMISGFTSSKTKGRRLAPLFVFRSTYMEHLWIRLESQLAQHAPELKASLRAPTMEAELFKVERETGLALPSEVRSAYLWHDGCERSNETPRYDFLFGSA